MEPGAEEISAGSNSSGMHSLQCSSQQQVNMHQQQKEELQQQGEQQHQQLMQEWQQQLEDPSDQQEQFELNQTQHPEQSQLQPYLQNEHQHLEPPQLQQKQQWQPDQQQQLQMQQMLQHTQQQHLQEMHSQQQKLQQSQDEQELVTQLQQQLQPQQQESPSQSEQQDMEVQLQQQELPLQELELQVQQQELALQLQQQQLPPQMPHEHLKQLPQTQQQQLEQSPAEPQQQHLQQLQQSQQHLQQPQQQQHSQHFPLQPQQQYVPQSQQQPQQSSLEPQHQHLQPLSQHQQLPLHPQQQHLPQLQQQTQQQQLQLLSQHQQQSQQLPLQSQEQHLPQSQQRPQQQLQQSTLPSQQQPQLQQAPLPSQQQHLQQLAQSQQQPQQKLQQMSLQQQQQHLQQSQQQAQQHLQQASISSHQQTQQQVPQPQQQLPHPQQQHLQPLSQPQKQHLQQLPQSQLQRSQQLPQAQQQLQQPQPQQQRSQVQPHLQQLSQSQQQLQQKQLQPQVQQQQQQQQLSSQHPSQPAVGQAATSIRGQNISGSHSISFGSLIPMILPHLSKEQSERLQGLYTRLRRNEVTKEDFLRATRNVVGDQMLVQAVRQMQQKHQGQSQLAPSSQASQLHQQQQQQQQQRQQQHAQGSSQHFMPQQSIHTQQLNEPQPFQQVSPTNLQPQAQRTSDFQPHSQSSAPASLTVSHSSSDNKTQQSRQPGEPRPEISSVHGNQTSTMNMHQVKHEVDRTMIGFPLSSQQQQQHLQVPPSSFPMYGRPPGNYSSQSFSASPGIPPGGVKALAQDSQPKQVMHPQVGVQAHGGPPQLSNIKNMPKYDLSKQAKRREDEERQKILQSSGAAHFSGQHQPSVWATSLDKEKSGNTGISPSSSVHIKQEINDNSDQQHNLQTLQPMKDNKGVLSDHGQSLMLTKTDSGEHQSIKTSGISPVNHPLGSSGLHSDHLMQAPLATSPATLHHTLSGFSGPVQMRSQVPSTPPSSMVGSQIKTPPKKMLIGQKKPFDASGPSTQLASKKQKVSAGYLDQSIDQLNDVTAVSGVNLREEEEQLFAGPKEESRATEAMRKVVREEEERIFLQKGSLRAKLAGISIIAQALSCQVRKHNICWNVHSCGNSSTHKFENVAKNGIKYISSDSERCLSLCVEERLRTMIGHLIGLSKQRVDLERASHKVTITSDVRRQILAMNKKAKDDLEKKQAEEAERLRKLNEIDNVGPEGEKDETRTKAQKAQKEEDDKMRANAANVAARAAVGGDDMLSKWQLMAEQARQKREGTSDGASNTRTNRDANRKSVVGGLKSTNVSDHQDAPSTGVVRNLGRTSGPLSQTKPVRSICIKDVIALLEREPQMTKSTLLYRLYERGVDCRKEKGTEIQNNENTMQ